MAAKQSMPALAGVPRVNLLPRVETDRRARLALTRVWALIAVGAVVVVGVVIGGSLALRWNADQALAAENARTAALTTDLAAQSQVTAALAARDVRIAFRQEAMASDFAWTPLVNSLLKAVPAGATMLEYTLAPGAAPVEGSDPSAEVGASGQISFSTADTRLQAQTVAALAEVPGVLKVDAGDMAGSGDNAYEFVVKITLDQTIYSGEFVAEGSK